MTWLSLLASVGITLVVTLSHIAWSLRFYGCRAMRKMGLRLPCPLYCSLCSGFWIGMIVGLSFGLGINVVLHGFATSAAAFVVSTWLRSHGEYSEPKYDTRMWRLRVLGK